jgi:hypothetical protein
MHCTGTLSGYSKYHDVSGRHALMTVPLFPERSPKPITLEPSSSSGQRSGVPGHRVPMRLIPTTSWQLL